MEEPLVCFGLRLQTVSINSMGNRGTFMFHPDKIYDPACILMDTFT